MKRKRILAVLLLTSSLLVGLGAVTWVSGKSRITGSYKPEFLPVKISVDSTGRVSFSWDQSIVTPIGVFSIGVSTTVSEPPNENELIVVVRRDGIMQEAFLIRGESRLQAIVVGTTSFTIHRNRVDIDVSSLAALSYGSQVPSRPVAETGRPQAEAEKAEADAARAQAEAKKAKADAARAQAEAEKAEADATRAQTEAQRPEHQPANVPRRVVTEGGSSAESKILRNIRLSEDDAQACGAEGTCRLLLNTVFARHGRAFVDPELRSYFSSQAWYHEDDDYSTALLTPTDWANVEMLRRAIQ